jgi:hypothetical protein
MNQIVPVSGYKTAMAIAAGIIFVVPGMLIGGLVAYIYLLVSHFGVGSGGSSWIPFLDGLMKILWFTIIPEVIRGFVAIWGALYASFWLFKNAQRDAVIFSVTSVYFVVSILMFIFGAYNGLLDMDFIGLAGLTFGLGSGAIAVREME